MTTEIKGGFHNCEGWLATMNKHYVGQLKIMNQSISELCNWHSI